MTPRSRLGSLLVLAAACGGTDNLDQPPLDGRPGDAATSDPDAPPASPDAPSARTNTSSLLFDGTNDFVRVPHHDALTGLAGLTIEAWVQPRAMTASAGIAIKARSNISNGVEYGLERSSFGSGDGDVAGASFGCSVGGVDLVVDQWTHIALTWGPGQRAPRIFQNGSLANTSACNLDETSLVESARDLFIGSFHQNGTPAGFWHGHIDEVRIWNVARTGSQLQADMRRMLDGTEPGLLAYWDFEDGTGDLSTDRTGNDHGGRLGTIAGPDDADPVWSSETPF